MRAPKTDALTDYIVHVSLTHLYAIRLLTHLDLFSCLYYFLFWSNQWFQVHLQWVMFTEDLEQLFIISAP